MDVSVLAKLLQGALTSMDAQGGSVRNFRLERGESCTTIIIEFEHARTATVGVMTEPLVVENSSADCNTSTEDLCGLDATGSETTLETKPEDAKMQTMCPTTLSPPPYVTVIDFGSNETIPVTSSQNSHALPIVDEIDTPQLSDVTEDASSATDRDDTSEDVEKEKVNASCFSEKEHAISQQEEKENCSVTDNGHGSDKEYGQVAEKENGHATERENGDKAKKENGPITEKERDDVTDKESIQNKNNTSKSPAKPSTQDVNSDNDGDGTDDTIIPAISPGLNRPSSTGNMLQEKYQNSPKGNSKDLLQVYGNDTERLRKRHSISNIGRFFKRNSNSNSRRRHKQDAIGGSERHKSVAGFTPPQRVLAQRRKSEYTLPPPRPQPEPTVATSAGSADEAGDDNGSESDEDMLIQQCSKKWVAHRKKGLY